MKEISIRYTAEFVDRFEVPDDWEWDGSLDGLLEHSDLPYTNGGSLVDWGLD